MGPARHDSDQNRTAQDGARLRQVLDHASGVLAASAVFSVSLGSIDLPELPEPPLAAAPDRAILQAVAPLYFAMEIECAGLTRALSALAGLYAAGALRLAPGPVAELLLHHHRSYEVRRPSDDRHAAYLRLFGTAPEGAVPFAAENAVNAGFDEAMLRLAHTTRLLASDALGSRDRGL